MKTEVLSDIKKAEEEYRTTIRNAEADRKKSLANAELEADNLLLKAANTAEEYKKTRMADARQKASEAHARIIKEGQQSASALKEKGSKNLDRAVELLVSRFKERLNVKA
jgi:V/A-type H+/Na+-transporting ATPase subunit G/H